MTNLFSRLFRYRPTAGRVPWEDHFTESFAAVLDHYPKLREGYAGHLIGRPVEAVIIDTQRTFDDARPDMWIDARDVDDRRHVVMVEHKMGAPAEWPQLKAYEERLRRVTPAETRTLVHIAGSSAAPRFEASGGVEFRCFKWFQICRWLQRRAATARSRGQHMEFVDEFLKFMGERGMTIEISMNELVAARVYKAGEVERRLQQILDSAWDDCGMEDTLGETDGRWNTTHGEWQRSPRMVRHNVHVEWGFDFWREGPEWDVSSLQVPSAYAGIWMPGPAGDCRLACPSGWKKPPKGWDGDSGGRYVWAREISELRLRGESLSALYLEFFTKALIALKAVL